MRSTKEFQVFVRMARPNVLRIAGINTVAKLLGSPKPLFRRHGNLLLDVPLLGFLEPIRFVNHWFHWRIMPEMRLPSKPPLPRPKHFTELYAAARFGHHRGNGVAPFGVVRRFLVFGRRIRGAIDLNEHEPGRIIGLLHHVEAGNAGFLRALAGVLDAGLFERLDAIRLYVHMDVDNQHGNSLTVATNSAVTADATKARAVTISLRCAICR